MESSEVISIIGAVGGLCTLIGGLFWKWLKEDQKASRAAAIQAKTDATNEREVISKMFSDSLKLLSEATKDNTLASREVAEATKQSAKEAKERNGHLAELQLKSQEMIDRNFEFYKKGFTELKCQKVKKQTVNEQVIKHSTEE
jgi:uncharacterized membrane-anchored protein YhcB (DUF1043 family)